MSLTERVAAYAARRYDLRVMLRMLGLIAALLLIQVQGPAFATPGIKYVTNDDGPNYWLDDGYGEEPPACVLFGIEPPGSCLNTFFPAGSVTGMYKADTGNWLAIEDMFAGWCGKADAPERDWIRVLQTALVDEQAAIALCNEQGLDVLELHGGLALLPIAIRLGYDELSMELLHRSMLEAGLTQRDLDSLLYLAASSELPMTTDALLEHGAQLRSTFVLALAEDGLDETEMDRLRPLLANGMHVDRLWIHAFLALANMQDASERQAMLDRGRDIAEIPLTGLGAMPEDRLLPVCLLDPSLLQQLIDNGLDLQALSDAQYYDLFTLAYQSSYMDFPDLAGEDAAPRLRELFEVMLANGLDLQDLRKVASHPSYPAEITTLHELVAECSRVGEIGIYDLFSSLGIDCNYTDSLGNNALMYLRPDSSSYEADFVRLVQLGADPLLANGGGDTPLQRVLRWGRLGLARQLLTMGVEPDAASCAALGLWPQFEAACAGLDEKETGYLRSFGLYLAASAGREGLREELLAMERPPLQAVIALGDLELLASLLASGEYEYEPRERLPDAIYTAMDQPDPEVLRMLLADQVQRASIEDYRMYITLYHGVLEGSASTLPSCWMPVQPAGGTWMRSMARRCTCSSRWTSHSSSAMLTCWSCCWMAGPTRTTGLSTMRNMRPTSAAALWADWRTASAG
ncbi:MAG: hypothetical protein H7A35_03405 [Planctomycetales bacterium]|nr:MAG: hypothetical protein H7A35_03405 [Planctomycetales bacterium]